MAVKGDSLRLYVDSVLSRPLRAAGTIPGVAVLAAAGRNGPGRGDILSYGGGTSLAWKAPGSSSFGERIICSADGEYLLCDGGDADKWIRVQVYTSFLAGGGAQARVYLSDVFNNGLAHDDVTAEEADAGSVEDYQVVMKNESAMYISQVKVWIDSGVSYLTASVDGGSYSLVDSETNCLEYEDMAPGEEKTLYLRRTIPASTSSDPDVLTHIHVSYFGL